MRRLDGLGCKERTDSSRSLSLVSAEEYESDEEDGIIGSWFLCLLNGNLTGASDSSSIGKAKLLALLLFRSSCCDDNDGEYIVDNDNLLFLFGCGEGGVTTDEIFLRRLGVSKDTESIVIFVEVYFVSSLNLKKKMVFCVFVYGTGALPRKVSKKCRALPIDFR